MEFCKHFSNFQKSVAYEDISKFINFDAAKNVNHFSHVSIFMAVGNEAFKN